jgi:hypothetical protein
MSSRCQNSSGQTVEVTDFRVSYWLAKQGADSRLSMEASARLGLESDSRLESKLPLCNSLNTPPAVSTSPNRAENLDDPSKTD